MEENNATTPGTGMTLREIGSVINTEEEHTYSQITINRKVWGLRDLGYVTYVLHYSNRKRNERNLIT